MTFANRSALSASAYEDRAQAQANMAENTATLRFPDRHSSPFGWWHALVH